MRKSTYNLGKSLLLSILLFISTFGFSQKADSTEVSTYFGGAITVTNKGISTIPSFTLGKPAVIFDFSVGRKLRFEPQLRFAMEGKPWTFIFWWRYPLVQKDKFRVRLGAHPALSFKTINVATNGGANEIIRVTRYLAGELTPTYSLTKNISVGAYYLYSYGVEKDIGKNNHFVALTGNFSNIRLSNQLYARFTPQPYYLRIDQSDGVYFTARLSVAKKNCPISAAAIINKKIQSNIPGDDLLWNASLIYAFGRNYVAR